jgi:hypothetical protein
MLIDGGRESLVATSLLDASNLIVLKVHYDPILRTVSILLLVLCVHNFFLYFCQESSVIHSNANLGVRGQGLLKLSGDGDTIEAQRLILSLFYSIDVRQYLQHAMLPFSLSSIFRDILLTSCSFDVYFS